MNSRSLIEGSLVAIVTPFDGEGKIDYVAFEKLLEWHVAQGTNGIVVCGTTGESAALTEEEYGAIISFTVEKINKRIPVIAGSGSNVTFKAVKYSKTACEAGVDAMLVINPYYNKPNSRGIRDYYSQIIEATSCPIILYNVPSRTGAHLPKDLVIELSQNERIIGVKDASGDLDYVMSLIQDTPAHFNVYSGEDNLAFLVATLGGRGCISVVANEIPAAFSKMFQLIRNQKIEEAREIHYQYLELMRANFIESNPIPVKTALHKMGFIQEEFRSPIAPFECEENKKRFTSILEKNQLI